MKKLLAAGIACTAILLAGCGFELRGSGSSAILPFSTLYVAGSGAPTPAASGYSDIALDLRRRLARSGSTTIVNDMKSAEAIVDIMNETRERVILSLNSQGRVREYTLNYRVTFKVRDNAGHELRPPTMVTVQRTLSFNESQVLAKEGEEQTLYRDMQTDMVSQILRRLAATRPFNPQEQGQAQPTQPAPQAAPQPPQPPQAPQAPATGR